MPARRARTQAARNASGRRRALAAILAWCLGSGPARGKALILSRPRLPGPLSAAAPWVISRCGRVKGPAWLLSVRSRGDCRVGDPGRCCGSPAALAAATRQGLRGQSGLPFCLPGRSRHDRARQNMSRNRRARLLERPNERTGLAAAGAAIAHSAVSRSRIAEHLAPASAWFGAVGVVDNSRRLA